MTTTTNRAMSPCLSEYALERHLLGLAPIPRERRIDTHLASCPTCRTRLEAMELTGTAALAPPIPQTLVDTLCPTEQAAPTHRLDLPSPTQERGQGRRRGGRLVDKGAPPATPPHTWPSRGTPSRLLFEGMAAALVAVVLTVAILAGVGTSPSPGDVEPFDGGKGQAAMRIYARQGDEVFLLSPGGVLHPGDTIELVADLQGKPYLMVIGLEASGRATVYYPFGSAVSGPVTVTGAPFGQSIVLDDYTGPEVLVGLFTATPVDVATVLEAHGAWSVEAEATTGTRLCLGAGRPPEVVHGTAPCHGATEGHALDATLFVLPYQKEQP